MRCPDPGPTRPSPARPRTATRVPPDGTRAAVDPGGPEPGDAADAPPGGVPPSRPPGGPPRNRPWPVTTAPDQRRWRCDRLTQPVRRPVRPGSARPGRSGEPSGRGGPLQKNPRGASDARSPAARSGGSGREPGATLAATRREDRATGTGVHAQLEAVGLRAAAVVRLEGTLAHGRAPSGCLSGCLGPLIRPAHRARSGQPGSPPSMDTDLLTVRTGSAQVKRAHRDDQRTPANRPSSLWTSA